MPLAQLSHLESRTPGGIPDEEVMRAQAALEDASALVADAANTDWDGQDVPGSVVAVVCSIAKRMMQNPYGMQSETMGAYTWRNETAGNIMTANERTIVRRAAGLSGFTAVEVEHHYGFNGPTWKTV